MTSKRWVALIAVVPLLAAGCDAASAPTDAGGGGKRESDPQAVRIVAVDYAFSEAPTELQAGLIDLTFDNRGLATHEVVLAGIGETPIDRFVDDLRGGALGFNPNPQPTYLDQVAVPSLIDGGMVGTARFTLTAGRYVLFCGLSDAAPGDEETPHYELGMLREVIVTNGDAKPELPETDGTIAAFDYGFRVDLEAGDRVVNFVNEGPDQIHFTTVEVYPQGVDAQEAEEAYAAKLEGLVPDGAPKPASLAACCVLSAGLGTTFRVEGGFKSGRTYAFACYVQDREGGEPHAIAYDMYEIVTIE